MSPPISLPSVLAFLVVCASVAGNEAARPTLSCANVLCASGTTCSIENGQPVCKCNDICMEIYQPVCGSNGKTYPNKCYLEREACQQKASIFVAGEGPCGAPEPCPSICTAIYKPVCSSDNVTYGNDCELEVAICRSNGRIRKQNDGECETFAPTPGPQGCKRCPKGPVLPVCGSDNKTYGNKCELERAACLEQRDLSVKFERPCGKIKVCPAEKTSTY